MSLGWQGFASALVQWQRTHGRHGLPWQGQSDPYRVWLSEIMLQQTQVATVCGYYERFLQQLPTVQALAQASEQQVMSLWSGLGYYSRARHLHACAQHIVAGHGGVFPDKAQALACLPGIGRSTASAISSVCFGERVPILDANARRVVARVHAFDADLSVTAHERQLWTLAEALLPDKSANMPAYTQAVMDLGAGVCTARNPACDQCPVSAWCRGLRQGRAQQIPVRTRNMVRSSCQWFLLLAHSPGAAVWMQRRPLKGIWAGMDCLPITQSREALDVMADKLFGQVPKAPALPVVVHTLTHRDLYLHTVVMALHSCVQPRTDESHARWVTPAQWPGLGLPAPIRRILLDPVWRAPPPANRFPDAA